MLWPFLPCMWVVGTYDLCLDPLQQGISGLLSILSSSFQLDPSISYVLVLNGYLSNNTLRFATY